MKTILLGAFILLQIFQNVARNKSSSSSRQDKFLSVFSVVKFPNEACGSTSGLNGTCYTSSQCESLGGSSSGSCASSFGVCCVFSLSCGGSSSQNNTYATISAYTVSSDPDPCTYTFCKSNSDVCKLRIDYESFTIASPNTFDSAKAADAYKWGVYVGDCMTDTLTVSNPGGAVPPVICGVNTGQHMWVPASDSCNEININVDTGNSGITRSWQIKVTQYECQDLKMPQQDCLQWHTAESGTIATFNWDTGATTIATSQTHLSSQYYDICFRRKRGFCSVCFSPVIGTATSQNSYGIGGSGHAGPVAKGATGTVCTGITTVSATETNNVANGDYITIENMQNHPGQLATTIGIDKMCGAYFTATNEAVVHNTVCTFITPFKLGVHFDDDEAHFLPIGATNLDHVENNAVFTAGAGAGWSGFYLNYWQVAC